MLLGHLHNCPYFDHPLIMAKLFLLLPLVYSCYFAVVGFIVICIKSERNKCDGGLKPKLSNRSRSSIIISQSIKMFHEFRHQCHFCIALIATNKNIGQIDVDSKNNNNKLCQQKYTNKCWTLK